MGERREQAVQSILEKAQYLVVDEVHDLSESACKVIKQHLVTKNILGLTATAFVNADQFVKLLRFIGVPTHNKIYRGLKDFESDNNLDQVTLLVSVDEMGQPLDDQLDLNLPFPPHPVRRGKRLRRYL